MTAVIDPGKSLGFGKSSLSYGLTATKQLSDNDTTVFEAGQIRFQTYDLRQRRARALRHRDAPQRRPVLSPDGQPGERNSAWTATSN
jgi:hypothetical protein